MSTHRNASSKQDILSDKFLMKRNCEHLINPAEHSCWVDTLVCRKQSWRGFFWKLISCVAFLHALKAFKQIMKHTQTHTEHTKQVSFLPLSFAAGLITHLIQAPSVRKHYRTQTSKHIKTSNTFHSNTHRAIAAFHTGGKGKILKRLYLCF